MAAGSGKMTRTENKPFRLLDLPPEIWSQICRLCVVRPCPERIAVNTTAPREKFSNQIHRYTHKPRRAMLVQPPITRVCRTLRAECLIHFYSDNLFWGYFWKYNYDQVDSILRWLDAIGPVNRAALRNFYFSLRPGEKTPCIGKGVGRWVDVSAEEVQMLKHEYDVVAPNNRVYKRWVAETQVDSGNVMLPPIEGQDFCNVFAQRLTIE